MRVLLVTIAIGQPAAVLAQSAPGVRPVVGQISLANGPLSQARVGNQQRFSIVPSVRTVYDTNVLRSFQGPDRPDDNFRITPGIDLSVRRQFGRVALGINGSAGYDFNSRYRFLDRSRVDMTGTARAPVGAICQFDLEAQYQRLQFDFGDTQQAVGTAREDQSYTLGANCNRSAGFAPLARFDYQSLNAGGVGLFDARRYGAEVGLTYAKPSLGVVTLSGTVRRLRRPNAQAIIGSEDGTDVRSLSVGLSRAVAPRIRFDIAAGITEANPKRAGVDTFVGLSWNSAVTWLITPSFVVAGNARRSVTNQNGFNATYVVRDDYGASVNWQASAKSALRLTASYVDRDFKGENLAPAFGFTPIGADSTTSLGAGYSYRLLRDLNLGFAVSHRWRDADNPIYNYKSTLASTSIGARF